MGATTTVADWWRHHRGECLPTCPICPQCGHTFFEVDVWLRDKNFEAWCTLMHRLLRPVLQGRSVEAYFGGIDQAYRTFVRMESGLPASLKGKEPMPPKPQPAASKKPTSLADRLVLPTEPSKIQDDINQFHFLIHGEKKIGKTTLTTSEPDVLVVSFDPLRPGLAIMQVHCPNWEHLKAYLQKLEAAAKDGSFAYKRIVLDRVDLAYSACMAAICKTRGITDPHEAEDYGMTWRALRNEFEQLIIRFMQLPCGVWFICHSEWKERKKNGITTTRLVPDLANRAEETINGLVDGWFAYDYVGERRVLYVQGDATIGAGHALDTHFLTPSGEPVREIDMGSSSKDAWAALLKAFNNQQEYTTIEELEQLEAAKQKAKAPAKAPVLKKVTKKQ